MGILLAAGALSLPQTGSVSPSCRHTYRISGLAVSAEMELPGIAPFAVPEGSEDVCIRLRAIPESLEPPEETVIGGPVWELDERRFLLRLPGIGRFLATDGLTLDMDPALGTDPADALPFLLGTGFGAVLMQRGGLVLHAAAVAEDGRAYAFCGNSGIGKSTLAAALCRAGCVFVNDDVCAIGLDTTGRPVVWSDGRRLKLFDESIAYLDLAGRRRGMVRAGIGKHYVEPPLPEKPERPEKTVTEMAGPTPLAAVYILRDQRLPRESGIERLSQVNGAQALLIESYRPRLALAMARRGRQVAVTAAILQHAAVFQLVRPRDFHRLTDTVAELRADWRDFRCNLTGQPPNEPAC